MFVVTVTFILKSGVREGFMPLMLQNARMSMSQEPGCQRFDVCEAPGRPEEVFLYELYDDEAAFAEHKSMDHYLEFIAQTEAMIADKTVRTYSLVT